MAPGKVSTKAIKRITVELLAERCANVSLPNRGEMLKERKEMAQNLCKPEKPAPKAASNAKRAVKKPVPVATTRKTARDPARRPGSRPTSSKPNHPAVEPQPEDEQQITALFDVQRLTLDRCGLNSVSGIELCAAARTVHLQHNEIETVEELAALTGARHIDLSHNRLTSLGGAVSGMPHLQTLLLAHNGLTCTDPASLDPAALPDSLMFLDVSGNIGCDDPEFIKAVVKAAPGLIQLNGQDVGDLEEGPATPTPAPVDPTPASIPAPDLDMTDDALLAKFEAQMEALAADGEKSLAAKTAEIGQKSRIRTMEVMAGGDRADAKL